MKEESKDVIKFVETLDTTIQSEKLDFKMSDEELNTITEQSSDFLNQNNFSSCSHLISNGKLYSKNVNEGKRILGELVQKAFYVKDKFFKLEKIKVMEI